MTNRTNESVSNTPEVVEKPKRRTFDAAYRLQIVEEADRCVEPGQVGQLLRREGLYWSHLSKWRRQRDAGALNGLRSKKRGRRPKLRDSVAAEELERLRREKEEIAERLRQAEVIIEVQKKVSELLEIPPTQKREPKS
jgi:transposase-like protein